MLAASGVVLLAVGPAACGSDGDDGDAGDDRVGPATESTVEGTSKTTTERAAATTTTVELTAEEEVVRDYEAASAAISAAANPPNPDSPELAAHFTGSSLSRYQATLRSLEAAGATAETTVEHHPTSVTIAGESAEVQDCFVDTSQQFNATTGEPLGGRHHHDAR